MKPKPIKIEVTQEDIDRGKQGSRCWCPIARAIKRTLYWMPGDTMIPDGRVEVSIAQVAIEDGRADLPFEASNFIVAFDRGEPVKPFSFELVESSDK